MSRRAWLTGNTTAAVEFICRRLYIPNDVDLIMAVNGAIGQLAYASNWEQFGLATADETAAMMLDMYLDYLESDVCMIGTVIPFATVDPPNHCLVCDGATYLRADYPTLYDRLLPGLQLDADSFQVPDLVDRTVTGAGNTYAPLAAGGEAEHTLIEAEMPNHAHTAQPHAHGYNMPIPLVDALGAVPEPGVQIFPSVTDPATVIINPTGGGQAHNNMPPYLALRYCIVAR